jgi:hypothetical protein
MIMEYPDLVGTEADGGAPGFFVPKFADAKFVALPPVEAELSTVK